MSNSAAVKQWKNRISVHDSNVTVALSNVDLCDADLEPLMIYVDHLLNQVWHAHWTYSFDIDLSCNCGITDFGVTVHILRFLGVWPACRRLKLYQTSIGNGALQALSPWVAGGYARELHLSDLCGTITTDVVYQFFKEICWNEKYPYWNDRGERVALWLRLEHNGLENVEQMVAAAQAEGMRLCVLEKHDMLAVRPGIAVRKGPHANTNAALHLCLFRMQHRKQPKQHDNVDSRNALLTMLHAVDSPPRGPQQEDPQPLSIDEYKLWVMEAREDVEGGADVSNKDTFGDDADFGWSFEENVAANDRLSVLAKQLTQQPFEALSYGGSSHDTLSREGRKSRVGCGDAKLEIEDEIQGVLGVSPMLRRPDFDGSIRQHLHAIRSVGGAASVRNAMHLVHEATLGKNRKTVQKWPAYLLRLLKHFLRLLKYQATQKPGAYKVPTDVPDLPTFTTPPSSPDKTDKGMGVLSASPPKTPLEWLQPESPPLAFQ